MIVDGVRLTLGGAVADLRAYIESRGGPGDRGGQPQRLGRLAPAGAADEKNSFHAEARQLLRYGSADELRSELAEARNQGIPGQAPGGAPEGEAGQSGGAAGLAEDDPRIARLRDRARLDLELTLRRYFADEVSFGHIETDEASRRWTLQGTQPGTLDGEAGPPARRADRRRLPQHDDEGHRQGLGAAQAAG